MLIQRLAIITFISLLPAVVFSAQKPAEILSLREIAFNRHLEYRPDLANASTSNESINDLLLLLNPNLQKKYIDILQKNDNQRVKTQLDFYDDNPLALFKPSTNGLENACKPLASQKFLHSYAVKLPFEHKSTWGKVACKTTPDNNLYAWTSLSNAGWSSMCMEERPSYYKRITLCDLTSYGCNTLSNKYYNLSKEINTNTNNLYLNEPAYTGKYNQKAQWLSKPQSNNVMDTFLDSSLVIIHPWGGIEIHNGQQKQYFAINHSLSSVSCSPTTNNLIALGSFDGTITIIDISREGADQDNGRQFKDYYPSNENILQHPPYSVNCWQETSNTPITAVYYCSEDMIYFSSGQYLYSWNQPLDPKSKPKNIHTSEHPIQHSAFKKNIIAYSTITNKVVFFDPIGNDLIESANHPCQINTICIYQHNEKNIFVTGDEDGNVIFWEINNKKLVKRLTLSCDFPVHCVEITNNQEKLLIKVTQRDKNNNIENETILCCPTPHQLLQVIHEREQQYESIQDALRSSANNAQELYDILQQNKQFLYASPNKKSSAITTFTEKNILDLIEHHALDQTDPLESLDLLIQSFSPHIDLDAATIVYFYAEPRTKNNDPLAMLNHAIENLLIDKAATVLLGEFKKNPESLKNRTHVVEFLNKYNQIKNSSKLESLIETLRWKQLPIQEKISSTIIPYIQPMVSFVKIHQYTIAKVVIAAEVCVIGYYSHKYINNNK